MARQVSYTVFSQDPATAPGEGRAADEWWRQHGPIQAASADAAIEKLRNMAPEIKANTDTLFFAVANFDPRKMEKELIEKWSLMPLSKVPAAPGEERTKEMEIDA